MDDDELCGLSCQTEPERLSHRAASPASRSLGQCQQELNRMVGPAQQPPTRPRYDLAVLPDRAGANVAEDTAGKLAAELARPSSLGGDDGDARGRLPPCRTEPAATLASAA
jgi:hypothetical protein